MIEGFARLFIREKVKKPARKSVRMLIAAIIHASTTISGHHLEAHVPKFDINFPLISSYEFLDDGEKRVDPLATSVESKSLESLGNGFPIVKGSQEFDPWNSTAATS